MVSFDAMEQTLVTLTVQAVGPERIELLRTSERGVTLYFDSPEDAIRRWNAWTGAAIEEPAARLSTLNEMVTSCVSHISRPKGSIS